MADKVQFLASSFKSEQDNNGTEYSAGEIINNDKTITLPDKSGVLALNIPRILWASFIPYAKDSNNSEYSVLRVAIENYESLVPKDNYVVAIRTWRLRKHKTPVQTFNYGKKLEIKYLLSTGEKVTLTNPNDNLTYIEFKVPDNWKKGLQSPLIHNYSNSTKTRYCNLITVALGYNVQSLPSNTPYFSELTLYQQGVNTKNSTPFVYKSCL